MDNDGPEHARTMAVRTKERTVHSIAETSAHLANPPYSDSDEDTRPRQAAKRITEHLVRRLGAHKYGLWFGHARFNVDGSRVEVATDSPYVARWIDSNFAKDLKIAAVDTLGETARVHVRVDAADSSGAVTPNGIANRPGDDATGHDGSSREHDRNNGAASVKSRRSIASRRPSNWRRLGDFVVGESNRLAFAAACRAADPSDDGGMAVLFIHGECGVGKTHLVQGIVQRWIEHTARTSSARYVTGEQFTNEFIAAIRNNSLDEFRRRMRKIDLLAIDDVHFLANKVRTQSEFLYTLDAIGLSGARIVLASDNHPRHIKRVNQALVSRFLSGMVVKIERPDRQTRIELIRRLATARGLDVNESAAESIASQCLGSVRELEGAVTRLAAVTTLLNDSPAPNGNGVAHEHGGGLSAVITRQLLGDQSPQPDAPVRLKAIIDIVCERMSVSMGDLTGSGRHRRVVQARAIVAYLARELTTHSYPEIAQAVGRSYHSTVHTADQRLRKQLADGAMGEAPDGGRVISLRELVDQLRYEVLKASSRGA